MKIVLESGRLVVLFRLEQWRTHAGLLCGTPTRTQNDERLRELLDGARNRSGVDSAVLVQPARTPRPGALAEGEFLPAITCIGVFDSGPLAKRGSEPYSSLAVAWMQAELALPIDAAVLAAIRAIDWEGSAIDWCW